MSLTSSQVTQQLSLFEFAPGRKVSWAALKRMLPDTQSALFFAKVYELDYRKVSDLVFTLFDTPLLSELSSGAHSVALQDYLADVIPDDIWESQRPDFVEDVPHGEFLPELVEAAEVKIAKAISEVADKLGSVLDALPSKEGAMTFQYLAAVNRQRPTIGDFKARIQHKPVPDSLVVLDVSGSMTEETIARIVDDVVALSWKANAHLAIVSNNTFVWEPGTYGTRDVLAKAEYGGTRYETLAPLFDGRNWGTVITIADYDSSYGAKQKLGAMSSRIGKVLDISLVNQPTFLAECVGQLADEVEPLLVATSRYVLSN